MADCVRRLAHVGRRDLAGLQDHQHHFKEWLMNFRPDWQKHALCRGTMEPGVPGYFPERGRHPGETKRMCEMCQQCPVVSECLEFALVNEIKHGIWGGLSERGRRKIRQQWKADRRDAGLNVNSGVE
jgi:WhiB family redox-sensing transcriptional regulator